MNQRRSRDTERTPQFDQELRKIINSPGRVNKYFRNRVGSYLISIEEMLKKYPQMGESVEGSNLMLYRDRSEWMLHPLIIEYVYDDDLVTLLSVKLASKS